MPSTHRLLDCTDLPAFVVGTTQLETWGSWEVRCLGTFRQIGGVLKAEIAKKVNDATKLTVGTNLPYGTPVDSVYVASSSQQHIR